MEQLLISLDAGFDGFKMIVGPEKTTIYRIPSQIIDISNREGEIEARLKENSFIVEMEDNTSKTMKAKFHSVGETALAMSTIDDATMQLINSSTDSFYKENLERFSSSELFRTMVLSHIGYAILKQKEQGCKITSSTEIIVGIALPDEINKNKETTKNLRDSLYGKHKLNIRTNSKSKEFETVEFELKKGSLVTQSQVLAVIFSNFISEDGDFDEEAIKEFLPAVVYDGGYTTDGFAFIDELIRVQQSESNTNYSMKSTNAATYKNIVDKLENYQHDDLKEYMIEDLAFHNKSRRYYHKDETKNDFVLIDFSAEQQPVLEDMAIKKAEYLIKNYKMNEVENLFVAGGAGERSFEYFKNAINKRRSHINVTIIKPTLENKELSPVFSIAAGLYKQLLNQFLKE